MPNYDNMWTMLESFQFEIDEQSMIHVKCIVCNKLLIDAYQGTCGCNYCKKCIDRFSSDGILTCPSQSNDCAMDNSNFKIDKDNSANKRVSKLSVKCPSNICEFTCELIQMSSHLEICDNIRRLCLFSGIGCTINNMDKAEMVDHLNQGLLHHNSLIMLWITNAKNDLTADIRPQVVPNDLIGIEKIIQLNLIDRLKTYEDQIYDQQKVIENVKRKNEGLKLLIDETINKFNKEIDELKANNIDLVKQINEEKDNIKIIINNSLEEKSENKCDCKGKFTTRDVVESTDLSRKTSCETLSNSAMNIGALVWNVNNISRFSEPWGTSSEPFYSTNQYYEMRLRLWLDGCRDKHKSTHICIEYTVTNSGTQNESHWPIECHVSISIKPINGQSISRILKQKILTIKKANEDFNSFSPWSAQFHFLISNLKQNAIICNDSIFIECHVNIIS